MSNHQPSARPGTDTVRRLALPLLTWLSAILAAPALAAPEPTALDYAKLPSRQLVTISPQGDKIAFRTLDEGRDLVVVYSLKRQKVIAGVDVQSVLPNHLYFVRNDTLVMVASETKTLWGYEGENEVSTAFSLNTDSGKISQLLTPGDEILDGQLGLGDIVGLSENQKHVYMPAFLPNRKRGLMKVNLEKPRRPKTIYKGHFDARDFFLDAQGDILAQERYDNENDLYSIHVPDGWAWKKIHEHKSELRTLSAQGLTPDRQSLVVLTENSETGRNDYFKLSLTDGTISPMSEGRNDADVEGVISGLDRVVHGLRYAGFTPSYSFFDDGLNRRVKALQEAFQGHSVRLLDWTRDWEHLVLYVEGPSSSGDYYLHSKGEGFKHITAARAHIPPDATHPVTQFEYQARDGLTIPALITVPLDKAQEPKNLPGIVLPHGGPHAYDTIGFDWLAQTLAEQGYLVVQPQFRGSIGFGRELWEAGLGEWGGRMQDDLTDAVKVLSKAGMMDPERVCIVGASYGGYAALAGATMTPDLYRCAVAINGVSDLNGILKEGRKKFGKHHWVLSYFEQSMGGDDLDRRALAAISPSEHADKAGAPILLIHAKQDSVVPIEQSELMHKRLEQAQKPVQFVELEGENHHLLRGKTRLKAMEHLLTFLDQHLTDKQQAAAGN